MVQEVNQGLQVVQNSNAKSVFEANRRFAKDCDSVQIDAHADGSFDDVLLCGECQFRTSNIDSFVEHKKKECHVVQKPRKLVSHISFHDLYDSSKGTRSNPMFHM